MTKSDILSENITKEALAVLEQFLKDNPDYPVLWIVQQLNLAALTLKQAAVQYEGDYKALLKGKTTNELH